MKKHTLCASAGGTQNFKIHNQELCRRTINHWLFTLNTNFISLSFWKPCKPVEIIDTSLSLFPLLSLSLSLDIVQESEFASIEDLPFISALDIAFIFFSNGILTVSNGSLNCGLQLFHGAITCRRRHRWSCDEKATICWRCPHGGWC